MTLTEFLLARIGEDEELARDAAGWNRAARARASGRWLRSGISSVEDDEQRSVIYSDDNQLSGTVADHVAHYSPARVLAECEAKRRIVEEFIRADSGGGDHEMGYGLFFSVQTLASAYADHPDFREEWRP